MAFYSRWGLRIFHFNVYKEAIIHSTCVLVTVDMHRERNFMDSSITSNGMIIVSFISRNWVAMNKFKRCYLLWTGRSYFEIWNFWTETSRPKCYIIELQYKHELLWMSWLRQSVTNAYCISLIHRNLKINFVFAVYKYITVSLNFTWCYSAFGDNCPLTCATSYKAIH